MAKLYAINLRWVRTQMNVGLIDGVLNQHGDWIRFNGWTWYIYTLSDANRIVESIRAVLLPEDSILVAQIAEAPVGGWAPQWVWDWFNPKLNPPKS
jgi:hypothetical protein